MEAPVVIVVAGFEMDDITLACALGRATTRAYIIVPIELLVGQSSVKSDFLREGLENIDRKSVLDQDARAPAHGLSLTECGNTPTWAEDTKSSAKDLFTQADGGDGYMKAAPDGAIAEFSFEAGGYRYRQVFP